MKKRLICLMLMFGIAFTLHKPVLAAPTSQQIYNQRNQLQTDKNEFKKAQDKRFEIEQNIESLDNQIEEVMDKMQENKKQMSKIQEDIKITEQELKQTEEDMKNEKELFNKRVRVIYVKGSSSYLDVLLEAKDFSDFFSRIETLKSIIKLDKKITENIKLKQEQLNNNKEELNKQNNKLVSLNNDNNDKMNKLQKDKSKQSKLIEEVKKQEKLYASAVNETQTKLNQTLIQIEAMRNSTSTYTTSREVASVPKKQTETVASSTQAYTASSEVASISKKQTETSTNAPSRGDASVSGNAVVAYASNFLGTPYLWGGTTPAGFDCSGFTQYVYKHFGITVGRTTYDQIKDGYAVSRNELQPGDLVFYGKGGSPTHMGIYVGNGMYIHAPRTGDVVKISPYNRSDYITARRVIQ